MNKKGAIQWLQRASAAADRRRDEQFTEHKERQLRLQSRPEDDR